MKKDTIILYEPTITRLNEIKKFILDNLSDDLTITAICSKFCIGKSTLRKQFAFYFKKNVHSFIKEYRLQKAMDLIKSHRFHINQIAEEIGYKDQSSFTRAFAKKYKHTPMHFLKQTK